MNEQHLARSRPRDSSCGGCGRMSTALLESRKSLGLRAAVMTIHLLRLVETSRSTAARIAGILLPVKSVVRRSCTCAHLIPTQTKFRMVVAAPFSGIGIGIRVPAPQYPMRLASFLAHSPRLQCQVLYVYLPTNGHVVSKVRAPMAVASPLTPTTPFDCSSIHLSRSPVHLQHPTIHQLHAPHPASTPLAGKPRQHGIRLP